MGETGSRQQAIVHAVDRITPRLIADRHRLHAHPELGTQEVETARFVAERSRDLGCEARPGCYAFVGARDEPSGKTWGHHPRFDIDERCLAIGAEVLVRTALGFLRGSVSDH